MGRSPIQINRRPECEAFSHTAMFPLYLPHFFARVLRKTSDAAAEVPLDCFPAEACLWMALKGEGDKSPKPRPGTAVELNADASWRPRHLVQSGWSDATRTNQAELTWAIQTASG